MEKQTKPKKNRFFFEIINFRKQTEIWFVDEIQFPFDEHFSFFEQQWRPSLQQIPFSIGQHDHNPFVVSQHVSCPRQVT